MQLGEEVDFELTKGTLIPCHKKRPAQSLAEFREERVRFSLAVGRAIQET